MCVLERERGRETQNEKKRDAVLVPEQREQLQNLLRCKSPALTSHWIYLDLYIGIYHILWCLNEP